MIRPSLRAALLAAAALWPLATAAQQPTANPPVNEAAADRNTDDQAGTADIIVTARKRSERLQDVPLTITAVDAAQIKADRIENLADVAKLSPALNYVPLFGPQNQLPIIRGAAQSLGEVNVGVFLDGVYLSGNAGQDLYLNDLERVEVVEGPQSALYGRNTFAGAINYITKRPSATLTGRIEGTVGANGLYETNASLSGPLSDTLRVRVGAFYRHFDGFYRSGIDGGKVDFSKDWGTMSTAEWSPTTQFTATLRFTYLKNDDGQPPNSVERNNGLPGTPEGAGIVFPGFSFLPVRNLYYFGQVKPIPLNGVTVNTRDAPGLPGHYGDREEAVRTALTLRRDFEGATLTSITSYDKRNYEYVLDGADTVCDQPGGCLDFGSPFVPNIPVGASDFALSASRGFSRDVAEELRLQSSGKRRIDWLAGFYFYDNVTFSYDNGYSGFYPLYNSGFNADYSHPRQRRTTSSYSGFGSLNGHFTDQLSLTVEARYEHEDKGFTQRPDVTGAPGDPAFYGTTRVFDLSKGFDFVTPRAILQYRIDPTKQVYASYARGAKTGGFNGGLNVFDNQRTYYPEHANNYEGGFKTDWLNGRLRLNADGYYIDWTDQQVPCQNPVSAGGSSTNRTYLCNVGASTIYGAEVFAVGKLSNIFSLTANYAWTHATYDRFVDANLTQIYGLVGQPAPGLVGNRLPYVPEHKFLISPQATVPLGDSRLELRADVTYQSRSYVRADNLDWFGSRTIVDLRATAYVKDLRVQLFINNLFDDRTPAAGVRFYDATNYYVSAPLVIGPPRREVGGTVSYAF